MLKNRGAPEWPAGLGTLQHGLAFSFPKIFQLCWRKQVKTVGIQLFLRDFVVNNSGA